MSIGTPVSTYTKPHTSDLDELRLMDFEQRLAWHESHRRHLFGGMYSIKVDGELAAVGYEDTLGCMFAAFLMFVARKIIKEKA